LAIYDEQPELSRKIINRAIESIQLPMKAYEPDGAYNEGYEYWRYGTTFNVYFIDALEKVFGTDYGLLENSAVSKTPEFLLNMVGPNALNFNFGDSESKCWLNPAMFWFANKQKNNSLLYSEKIIAEEKYRVAEIRDLPTVMIWGAGIDFNKISEPDKLIWVGHGKSPVALFRSSWDHNGIYVGLKGGSPRNNVHAHMDVGSFVMDALGERWAMDFGAQSYNSLESKGIRIWSTKQESQRWQVFRYNNLAHNTLSFDKELQRTDAYAPIKESTSGKNFLSAIVDLTETYNTHVSNAQRGIAIVDGNYVVIRDEIELNEQPSTIRWTMVTPAVVNIINGNTAELIQNGKKLLLKVQEPASITLITWSTKPTNDYDEENPGTTMVGFEIKQQERVKIPLTVLLVPGGYYNSVRNKIPPLSEWKEQK